MIEYKPVVHDAHRTIEQQVRLFAEAAAAVWYHWSSIEVNPTVNPDDPMTPKMVTLFHQLREMDIFMSGRASQRNEK